MNLFWNLFHKMFGHKSIHRLSFPMSLLGEFRYHYYLYDNTGTGHDGAETMVQAIKKAKSNGLYIVRCTD